MLLCHMQRKIELKLTEFNLHNQFSTTKKTDYAFFVDHLVWQKTNKLNRESVSVFRKKKYKYYANPK